MIEPWTMGVSRSVTGGGATLVRFSAIPIGVRILWFTAQFELNSSQEVGLAVTVGEAPARVIGDMEGQRSIFTGGGGSVAGLTRAIYVRTFAGIATVRWWAWDLEIISGPAFVSVAFDPTSVTTMQAMFGLVGFRRIKADEDP